MAGLGEDGDDHAGRRPARVHDERDAIADMVGHNPTSVQDVRPADLMSRDCAHGAGSCQGRNRSRWKQMKTLREDGTRQEVDHRSRESSLPRNHGGPDRFLPATSSKLEANTRTNNCGFCCSRRGPSPRARCSEQWPGSKMTRQDHSRSIVHPGWVEPCNVSTSTPPRNFSVSGSAQISRVRGGFPRPSIQERQRRCDPPPPGRVSKFVGIARNSGDFMNETGACPGPLR